jgi:hypothetical protein
MPTLEKTRNIIPAEGGEPFAIHQHIITRNFWEYYLGEVDEYGIAYGYVMGDYNEWGNVDVKEIEPYIISRVSGDELDDVMPPFQYHWENE